VPFGLICFSVVTLWYALHGHAPDDVTSHRTRARWYTTKTEPSYDDMTVKLRRVIIAARSPNPCPEQAPRKKPGPSSPPGRQPGLAQQRLRNTRGLRAAPVLADSPDDHDWAALRHRRCSRVVVGEGRVGRAVCDDNVTTDDPAAGQGVVAGLGGCAGCRTRAEMARRLVKRSLLGQGATRTPPSPAGRPRPACRA
jgi:hypothetical protein